MTEKDRENRKTEKTRVSVRIAGRFLTILTDEDPAAVREIEKELESRIEEMARLSPRMATKDGKIDALVLCAIDALNREGEAEKRAEEAEKRAEGFERKYRQLRDEYAALTFSRSAGIFRMAGEPEPEKNGGPDGPGGADPADDPVREETIGKIREILIRIRDRDRERTEGEE